jgi:hypothetical protein
VTIPAATLVPGRTYQCRLLFAKVSGSNTSYTGVPVNASYIKINQFNITTTGSPLPIVLLVLPLSNGSFQFRVTGEKNRQYDILESDDLATWNQYHTGSASNPTNQFGGYFDFTDDGSSGAQQRFYRVREFVNQQNN